MPRMPRVLKEDMIPCTGTALYQMAPCSHCQMMGYILRTESGKLFLIDGGTKADADAFLALARRVSGTPDGAVLPIEGWFLTHPHHDHIGVLLHAWQSCRDTLSIAHLYYNFPDADYLLGDEGDVRAQARLEFATLEASLAPISTVLHAGDSLSCDGIQFDILREVNTEIHTNTGNNASMIFSVTRDGQRILFLGDAGIEAGEELLRLNPPEAVRADIVQAAHHGQSGVAMDVYAAIAPRACLWNAPDWLWKNDAGQGYGTGPWKTLITRCFLNDLGVRHHFVEKDGIWELPLPLTLA